MDTSTALEIFSDEELWIIFQRSECLGHFGRWLSRVRGDRDPCCERQEVLDQESIRYGLVEEGGDRVVCIGGGFGGKKTIREGDCLDGLKAKLSEIRSEPEQTSEEIHPEPEEVQDHKPKTISTKPEAPSEPKDIMEIKPDFPKYFDDIC